MRRALATDLQQYTKVLTPDQIGFVYLAGPYRGKNARAHDWTVACEIKDHVNLARKWAVRFARDGIPYFCPHLNSESMELLAPDAPTDYWLSMDLTILHHANALFLLPGWEDSQGAVAERDYATSRPINIYTFDEYAVLVKEWGMRLDDKAFTLTDGVW